MRRRYPLSARESDRRLHGTVSAGNRTSHAERLPRSGCSSSGRTAAPERTALRGGGRELEADSPHILVNASTGGGKSATLRCIACQMLHHGSRVFVLDPSGSPTRGRAASTASPTAPTSPTPRPAHRARHGRPAPYPGRRPQRTPPATDAPGPARTVRWPVRPRRRGAAGPQPRPRAEQRPGPRCTRCPCRSRPAVPVRSRARG
ncbi:DUF87 domain-containing protein [Streptomyces sp. AcE210]|nr:DUF87 domain-containing protein [Streptomyces sp. AcE210]